MQLQKVHFHNHQKATGIVDQPEDYRYNSARNYMEREDTVHYPIQPTPDSQISDFPFHIDLG